MHRYPSGAIGRSQEILFKAYAVPVNQISSVIYNAVCGSVTHQMTNI